MKFVYDRTPSFERRLQLTTILASTMIMSAVVLGAYVVTDTHIAATSRSIEQYTVAANVHRSPFEGLELEAQAVHVWDMARGTTLYAHNASDVYALASITKIATALTAQHIAPDSTVVALRKDAIEADGDDGLRVNERWRLKDLLDFTLVASSNDGARGVAAVAGARRPASSSPETAVQNFVSAMNETIRDAGLTDTVFYNPSGLDINESRSGGYGTARDVSRLMAHTLKHHPDLIEATQRDRIRVTSLSSISHVATNTNPDTPNIPGLLGSKTGYTDISGGNLVIAFDPFVGRPVIITVLGSSYEGRFRDVEKLVDATLASFALQS